MLVWAKFGLLFFSGLLGCCTNAVAFAGASIDFSAVSSDLQHRGFTCNLPVATQSLSCIGRIDGYSGEVAVLIPPRYRVAAFPEMILHLHGHNVEAAPLKKKLAQYDLAHVLAASQRNALMVVPHSTGLCAEYDRELADGPHFHAFVARMGTLFQAVGLAQNSVPGRITLSGHSGSYRALSMIIQNGEYTEQIQELYLLDGLYGRSEVFAVFAQSPNHRFWSVYQPGSEELNRANQKTMEALRGAGIPFFQGSNVPLNAPMVRGDRVGFAFSDVDHEQVVNKYLPILLEASSE
ncbi:hypothetical protein WDW37_03915 [Bdellovibrionota bacterium FG-1]